MQHVGKHEAAFGVGVDDLDGLARHGLDDVAGPLRLAVGHVLDEADGADGVDLGLARGERMHEADDAGGARHVALHVLHALRRLDRDAAGIEAHALADEGDRIGSALAAVPAHDDEPRNSCAEPWPTPSSAPMPSFFIAGTSSTSTLTPSLVKRGGAARELRRIEDVRRLIDEVARQDDAVGDARRAEPKPFRPRPDWRRRN